MLEKLYLEDHSKSEVPGIHFVCKRLNILSVRKSWNILILPSESYWRNESPIEAAAGSRKRWPDGRAD